MPLPQKTITKQNKPTSQPTNQPTNQTNSKTTTKTGGSVAAPKSTFQRQINCLSLSLCVANFALAKTAYAIKASSLFFLQLQVFVAAKPGRQFESWTCRYRSMVLVASKLQIVRLFLTPARVNFSLESARLQPQTQTCSSERSFVGFV